MNTFWQRFIVFFIIGLPITLAQVKKYWYAVILWLAGSYFLLEYMYKEWMRLKFLIDFPFNNL